MGSEIGVFGFAGVFAVVAAVGLFLLMRSLVLWYWKIDEMVTLLQSIDQSLKALPAVRRDQYQRRASTHNS